MRANPGPARYGPEPGSPPNVRGLIPEARRLNGGLLWIMGLELVAKTADDNIRVRIACQSLGSGCSHQINIVWI